MSSLSSLQVSKLPARADRAVLERVDWGRFPRREGKIIRIPNSFLEWADIFCLQGGRQLLIRSYDPDHLCFLGTDEQPFCVELQMEALRHFQRRGEEGFYEVLKPLTIMLLEQAWGRGRTGRQGDIFTYKLRHNMWWPLIKEYVGEADKISLRHNYRDPLFRTRHLHTGYYTTLYLDECQEYVEIGDGRIEAPDHSTRLLKGPHVFAQTRFLKRPQEAD